MRTLHAVHGRSLLAVLTLALLAAAGAGCKEEEKKRGSVGGVSAKEKVLPIVVNLTRIGLRVTRAAQTVKFVVDVVTEVAKSVGIDTDQLLADLVPRESSSSNRAVPFLLIVDKSNNHLERWNLHPSVRKISVEPGDEITQIDRVEVLNETPPQVRIWLGTPADEPVEFTVDLDLKTGS